MKELAVKFIRKFRKFRRLDRTNLIGAIIQYDVLANLFKISIEYDEAQNIDSSLATLTYSHGGKYSMPLYYSLLSEYSIKSVRMFEALVHGEINSIITLILDFNDPSNSAFQVHCHSSRVVPMTGGVGIGDRFFELGSGTPVKYQNELKYSSGKHEVFVFRNDKWDDITDELNLFLMRELGCKYISLIRDKGSRDISITECNDELMILDRSVYEQPKSRPNLPKKRSPLMTKWIKSPELTNIWIKAYMLINGSVRDTMNRLSESALKLGASIRIRQSEVTKSGDEFPSLVARPTNITIVAEMTKVEYDAMIVDGVLNQWAWKDNKSGMTYGHSCSNTILNIKIVG